MFIIIKHGDNQEFLVNSNCTIQILLHYVRTKTGLRKTDIIDLCDESGTLKLFFLSKTPGDYACKFLTARNTYYVCKVERGAPGKGRILIMKLVLKIRQISLAFSWFLDSLRTQCEFLERSRIKLLRALEAKRLAALEASKSSMRLQARRAKSRTKQSKGGRPEDNRGRRGYYKSRTHFQNT
uniref:Predicted gene 614 n=1 Tax=Jaculus jaculus TaxID=51337 RepID=A0A8C5L4V8_JACJA